MPLLSSRGPSGKARRSSSPGAVFAQLADEIASTHLIKDGIPLRFSVTDEDNPENSRAEIKVKLWSIQMGFMGVRSLTFVHHPKAFRIWLSLQCKVP